MDMRINKWRNVLTQARVNFSQSETSSLLRGGEEGELNFELPLWEGVERKDPHFFFKIHEGGKFAVECVSNDIAS